MTDNLEHARLRGERIRIQRRIGLFEQRIRDMRDEIADVERRIAGVRDREHEERTEEAERLCRAGIDPTIPFR